MQKDRREDGFTLIEILTVILIIGILTAIAVPVFLNQKKKAQDAALQSDIHQIKLAYQQYNTSNPKMTVYPDLVLDWKNQEGETGANADPAGIKSSLKLTSGSRFHVFDGSAYNHGDPPGTTIVIEAGRDGSSLPGYQVSGQRYIEVYKP
jgi:prepilin-type N-terminal cleavage/methylation domain-containing protein